MHEPLAGELGAETIADADRRWLAHVVVGNASRQLTVRAVVTGMLLGAVLALGNLYVALKTGFNVGVTLTAAVVAFMIWSLLRRISPRIAPFGALENNAMQSVASAAGFMTGGGTVAAIPALMLLTGYRFTPLAMMAWISVLALLGVFVAIPLKRQLINVEQLRFPSGVAAAETVLGLHAEGPEARTKARALGLSALVGGIVAFARDAIGILPAQVPVFGKAAARYTISADMSLVMVGAGAIMGLRVTLSQLAGSVLCYGVLAPWARSAGAITGELKYKNIVGWSVWIGSSMMLTAGLLHFALAWRTVRRAFADAARILRPGGRVPTDDPLARVEVPASWFLAGFAVVGLAAVALQRALFGIPAWMGVLAVLLSMLVGIVSARSTGETDSTASGPLGKVVQLVFGGLHPGSVTTNLATAHVAAGVAVHASDLLTDLKSGYLLGAKPRQQFFAQFFGVLAGSIAVVPAYLLLIPDVSAIGSDRYPAPAAQSWAAVAKLLAGGAGALHPTARWGIAIGGLVGVILVLLERAFPRHKRFIPSPMGLGLAFTIPAWNAISMAAGALAAFALERKRPKLAAILVLAVASGVIAGESLIGVVVNLHGALAR